MDDRRIGSRSTLVQTRANRLMLIPDEIRKCVAFVAVDAGRGRALVGTCVFVGLDVTDDRAIVYAVTAAHVIEGIRSTSIDGKVYLRVNGRGGGIRWFALGVEDWRFHPTDARVDVAAAPISWPFDEIDHLVYPMTGATTNATIAREGIGPGEEVFLTGLFVNHAGHERNIPIIRVGNIAAMPTEPIRTARGEIDAYLVEARSIGGLSGSPVFIHLGLLRLKDGRPVFATNDTGIHYLLGIMHGHYQVGPFDQDSLRPDGLPDEAVNMGIAIVTPASMIQEVLDHPDFTLQREEAREQLSRERLPMED